MFDWILIFLRTEHTRGGIVNNCPHHYLGVYLVIILSRPEASVPRLRVTGYGGLNALKPGLSFIGWVEYETACQPARHPRNLYLILITRHEYLPQFTYITLLFSQTIGFPRCDPAGSR